MYSAFKHNYPISNLFFENEVYLIVDTDMIDESLYSNRSSRTSRVSFIKQYNYIFLKMYLMSKIYISTKFQKGLTFFPMFETINHLSCSFRNDLLPFSSKGLLKTINFQEKFHGSSPHFFLEEGRQIILIYLTSEGSDPFPLEIIFLKKWIFS